MKRRSPSTLHVFAVVAASLVLGACTSDPVHDAEVAALGPEQPGVPKGQYHRANQPCLVCHGGEGPAKAHFSIAGTIFGGQFSYTQNDTEGVPGATVIIVDDNTAAGYQQTNCVGNFWFNADSSTGWPGFPAFPILAEVVSPTGTAVQMRGGNGELIHISRDGSCATCHSDPTGLSTCGHVFVPYNPGGAPPACPVNPIAGESS
jgi:hypothetical protein